MPAVKLLHQQSESNTKPEYIMGHSMQAVGLLVHAAKSVFSVPLAVRIHEGLVWSNRDKRTLLDKMLGLLDILAIKAPFYFVADAYYAAGKMANGLLEQGNHLVTRVKSNAVAYAPAPRKKGRKTRGRPKTYGKKIKLKSLLANVKSRQQVGVEPGPQVQGAHDAGDAEQFHPHRQTGHGGDEPHEGAQARECRAQKRDCIPPDAPQR
jgi:hypothetical protein